MKHIEVSAAAIFDQDGRLFIAQRAADAHQGGLWEFPGGKQEPGETPELALIRELDEEIGIQCEHSNITPLIRIEHQYPDKAVVLNVFRVSGFKGHSHGKEGQPVRWIDLGDINSYQFPAANLPIITALSLPDKILVTGNYNDKADFKFRLERALQSDISLVLLRAKETSDDLYRALAAITYELCQVYQARFLIYGDWGLVEELKADGLHLPANTPLNIEPQIIRESNKLLSMSTHNFEELQKAEELAADFVFMSPVQKTQTHPDATALGWRSFSGLCDKAKMPVYALGGMQNSDIPLAIDSGAQGIAAISDLWEQ